MNGRKKMLSCAVVAVLAAAMLVSGESGANASTLPKLTLDSTPLPAGHAVGVTGTHFGPVENVAFTFAGLQVGGGLTDPEGTFTSTLAAPLFFPPRTYELDAIGLVSGLRATVGVRVVAGCNDNFPPPTPSPLTATVHDQHTLQIAFSVANFHCSVGTLQLTDGNWHAVSYGGAVPFDTTGLFNPFPTDPDHVIPAGTSTVSWVLRAPGEPILTGTATVTNTPPATPGATGVQVRSGGSVIAGPVPSATGTAASTDSTSDLPDGFTTTQPITATDGYPAGTQDVADPGTLTMTLGSAGTLSVTNLDVNLHCFATCDRSTTFTSLTLSLNGMEPMTLTEAPAPNTVYRFPGVGSLKLNTQSRPVGALQATGIEFVAADGTSYVAGTVVGGFPSTEGNQLAFVTGPVAGATGSALGPITIQAQDATDAAAPVLRKTTITLRSSSSTGVFSKRPGGAPITSITIAPGESIVSVYYSDTTPGTPRLTAKATGYLTGSQKEVVLG